MLKSLVVGVLLTSVTVGIHAAGTTWWIQRLKRYRDRITTQRRTLRSMRVLCSTAVLLLMLHILEVAVWAAAYLLLPNLHELNTLEQATYFSIVSFSSLGFGDLVIEGPPWRMLSGIQAMTGLLIFGWSTALFFAVVENIWNEEARSLKD